jgi:drug/metabolite transporter (DMT)-like permease
VTSADLISYLLAAIAASGNALANVMQRKASLQQPPDTAFSIDFLRGLLRDPTWILGFGGMVVAFVFQAIALGVGQLSAVEPVFTLEVPLTLLIASRVLGAPVARQEWASIVVLTVGMITLVAALDPSPGRERDVSDGIYVVAGVGTVATMFALLIVSQRANTFWRTACRGAAAGTSFGLTATLMKEAINTLTDDGVLAALRSWQLYAAIGLGVLGVLIMQWALHSGPIIAAQPGFTLMDPLVSILWGVLVYNEATRTGGWLVLATAGAIAIGVGVALLARSPLFAAALIDDQP